MLKKWFHALKERFEPEMPAPLQYVYQNWNQLGEDDPLWAISTNPEKKGKKWKVEDFFKEGEGTINFVFSELASHSVVVRNGSALDFGCGAGRLTQSLVGRFQETHGVDIADSMIQIARDLNRHPTNCFYHLNKSQDLRLFQDNTFDFVFTLITLQHIPKEFTLAYVAEFLRICKPGGIIYFQLPAGRKKDPDHPVEIPRDFSKVTVEKEPVMLMSGVPRLEVESWIKNHGGSLLYIIDDEWSGDAWESYRYCIQKI